LNEQLEEKVNKIKIFKDFFLF